MAAHSVLLVGYYGKANFGDDVLLKVTHGLVKEAMPQAQISVIVDGDSGDYVRAMLGEVTILKPGRHGYFDYIIHGGGGVFFDFGHYGPRRRMAEKISGIANWRIFLPMEKIARGITNRRRTEAGCRLGLGIGVGGFSSGSPRLLQDLPVLTDFSALWLRDVQSIRHLWRFKSVLQAEVILGSDLAFLKEQWMPPLQIASKQAGARPRLGIVLRDWPETDMAQLQDVFARLAQAYEITGFIFDTKSDPQMQKLLSAHAASVHLWQPGKMTIADFSQHLQVQDLLLTSRAHGAICGACLGVPSVIVDIESKLKQVHAMLPNASLLVATAMPQQWEEALRKALQISPEMVNADIEKNRAASTAAWQKMGQWLP